MRKSDIRNKHRLLLCSILSILLFFILAVCALAADPEIIETSSVPPILVLRDEIDGKTLIGDNLKPIRLVTVEYCLFLPSSCNPSSLLIRYTGERTACLEPGGKLYQGGEQIIVDVSDGKLDFYEYDSLFDRYYLYSLQVMISEYCPAMYMNLDGGDQALVRINTSKRNRETGALRMVEEDGRTRCSARMSRLSGHGNTSYSAKRSAEIKNPLNMTLEKSCELIPNGGFAEKWVLIAGRGSGGATDPSLLSYYITYRTYNELAGPDNAHTDCRFVDLYINGQYRGIYLLTDRMDNHGAFDVTDLDDMNAGATDNRTTVAWWSPEASENDTAIASGVRQYTYDADSQLKNPDADISGGYVLECVGGGYENHYGFTTSRNMSFQIKGPTNPTREEVIYIATYIQEFEDALYAKDGRNKLGKYYTEYIDLPSFALHSLVEGFYVTWELYITSTYMSKDAGDVLRFGPAWDFESAPSALRDNYMFTTLRFYNYEPGYYWMQQAWQKGDFLEEAARQAKRLINEVEHLLEEDGTEDYLTFPQAFPLLQKSEDMNWLRWNIRNADYQKFSDETLTNLRYRVDHYKLLWEDTYLTGLTVTGEVLADGSFCYKAIVGGSCDPDSIIWYECSEDGTLIESGRGDTFSTDSCSDFIVSASGLNNAYYEHAEGQIFKDPNITVFSNHVKEGRSISSNASHSVPASQESDTTITEDNLTDYNESETGIPIWVILTIPVLVAIFGALFFFNRKKTK